MTSSTRQSMGLAAIIMAVSVLISRFMGLFRDKIIAHYFGASVEADLYFAAFIIPDFLHYLLAGGYISTTLIPLLTEKLQEDVQDAWRFLSAVLTWVTLCIGFLTLVVFVFAPEIISLVMPTFSPEDQERLAFFLRIILPAQVFFLPGACFTALLFIRKKFFVPALVPLLYNGSIIVFGLLWIYLSDKMGQRDMTGFCIGVSFGAFFGALCVPMWAVFRQENYFKLSFCLQHPLLKKVLLLTLPLMIGQSIVVLDEQFLRYFGAMAGDGAVSLLSYSRRLMMVPVGIVAQAAGIASFPFLASLMAKKDMKAFDATLGKALSSSVLVVIPTTAILFALAEPLLGLLFEGGSFSREDTLLASPLLQIMLLIVPFWTLQQLFGRAFYAAQDTLTPALLGTLTSLLVLPVYYLGVQHYSAMGVAFSGMIGVIFYTILLLFVWSLRYGFGSLAFVLSPLWKSIVLSTPLAFLAYELSQKIPEYVLFEGFWAYFVILAISSTAFGLAYLFFAYLFLPEVWSILSSLRRKA